MEKEPDSERILENVILNHLARTGNVYLYKNRNEADFHFRDGLKPLKGINSIFEACEDQTLHREIKGLEMIKEKYRIPVEMVSDYPIDHLPRGIDDRMAKRYLIGSR